MMRGREERDGGLGRVRLGVGARERERKRLGHPGSTHLGTLKPNSTTCAGEWNAGKSGKG